MQRVCIAEGSMGRKIRHSAAHCSLRLVEFFHHRCITIEQCLCEIEEK